MIKKDAVPPVEDRFAGMAIGKWRHEGLMNFPCSMKISSVTFEQWLSILLLFVCFFLLLEISYYAMFTALRHDGAYNLQVVDLLARGEGYASYGALRGDGKWMFDPHVTTGPAVLIPLSIIWYITGKSVAAINFVILATLWLYIIGLVFLFKKWNRGSSLLVSLAVGSSLCIVSIPNLVGELLGEIPAAAAIVWAAWAIRRNNPWIFAILAGFSIQMKAHFGLAAIILFVIYIVWNSLVNNKIRITQILIFSLVFFLPTILFEIYRFVSLGNVENYMHSIERYAAFVASFNVDRIGIWFEPDVVGEKISVFYRTIPDAAWIACGASVFLISFNFIFILFRVENMQQRYLATEEFTRIALVGLMVAGSAILITWMTQLRHANFRLSASFFLLFLPAFFAIGGYCYIQLHDFFSSQKNVFFKKILLHTSIILCSFFIILSLANRIMNIHREKSHVVELSVEEDRVSDLILKENPASLYVDGWHQNPNHLVLTGIPGVPAKTGMNQIMIIQNYQVRETGRSFDEYSNECEDILYRSDLALVCRLPKFDSEGSRLHIVDWGPRETRAGVVPGIHPYGYMGMWVKVDKVDRREVGPVEIYFAGYPSIHGHFSDGEVVTAAFPPRRIQKPGNYEVTIRQMATGHIYHVGYFVVD